jgi:hypothetical protein
METSAGLKIIARKARLASSLCGERERERERELIRKRKKEDI